MMYKFDKDDLKLMSKKLNNSKFNFHDYIPNCMSSKLYDDSNNTVFNYSEKTPGPRDSLAYSIG